MDLAALTARLTSLRERAASLGRTPNEAGVVEVQQGTLTAMRALYGEDSSNERQLLLALDRHRQARPDFVSMAGVFLRAPGHRSEKDTAGLPSLTYLLFRLLLLKKKKTEERRDG